MRKQLFQMDFFRAQGTVEYVVLISLLVIGTILVLNLFGISVSDVYCDVTKALGSEQACVANEAYCDDSFDTDLNGWQSSKDKLSVQNGQMCFSNPLQSLNQCSMNMGQSDYVVKLDDVILNKGDGYGVFVRAKDDGKGLDGYIMQYDPGLKSKNSPNGLLIIRKWVNGREISEPIASTPMGPDVYNAPHDIEISVDGETIEVSMDGRKVLTAEDGTYASGGSGIRSWDGSSACIGNFSILGLPE